MKDQKEIIDVTKSTLPTLSSRAMFWRPKYLSESIYVEHIPFYFWLVEAQQTKLAFEPDINSGSSYFAICQAVDKLNIDSRCFATIADGCEEPDRIEGYNYENYREFSFIQDETVKDGLYDFEDGSIDMLVLEHDSELVRNKGLMDRYLEKLSDEAIVLIQGSKQKGIKPLCRKLKESYKTFEFDHGDGLLVVCYGENQSRKVLSLVSHKSNEAGSRVIQSIYSRLGASCRESWLNSVSQKQISELNQKLDITQSQLIGKSKQIKNKDESIEKLRKLVSNLEESNSISDVKVSKLEKINEEIEASKDISNLQIQQLREELESVFSNNEEIAKELSKSQSGRINLEAEINQKKEKYESENSLLMIQVQQLQNELEKEYVEKSRIKSELDALLENRNELNTSLKRLTAELKLEKAKQHKADKGHDSNLKVENEIAMLQIKQLQEELELYFNKYQDLVKSKELTLDGGFSEARLERSLQLSKLVAS